MPQGHTLLDEVAGQGGGTLLDEIAGPEPAKAEAPSFLESAGQAVEGVAEQGIAALARGVGTAIEQGGKLASRVGNVLLPGDTTQAERKRRLQRGGPVTRKAFEVGQELKQDVAAVPPPEGVAQNIAAGVGTVAPALIAPEVALPYFAGLSSESLESIYDETLKKTGSSATAFEALLASMPVEAVQFAAPAKAVGALGEPAMWAKKVAGVLSKLSPKTQQVAVKMIEGAANGFVGAGAASVGHDLIARELSGEDLSVLEMAGRAGKAAGYGSAVVALVGGAHALAEGAPAKAGEPKLSKSTATVETDSAPTAATEPQTVAPEEFRHEGDQVPEAVPGTPEPARERSPEEIQGALEAARAESQIPAGMEAVPRILRAPGQAEPRGERPTPRFVQPPREPIQRAAADPDLKAAAVEFEKASQRRKLDIREQLQDNLHEFLTPEDIKDIADWMPEQATGEPAKAVVTPKVTDVTSNLTEPVAKPVLAGDVPGDRATLPQEPQAARVPETPAEPSQSAPGEPAKAQEAEPEPERATSIKDAQLEADRVRYGLPPVVKEAAREFGPEWESVGRKMEEDPSLASRVVADEHVPGLEKHKRQIVAMREKIAAENEWERIKQAQDDAATARDPAREAELRPLAAAATDRLDAAIGAAQREISASGRGLSFVRLMARHDFSLAALERQERISSGGKPLTDVQMTEIRALHDELAKLESDFEAFRARREQALSERAAKRVEASPEKKARVLSFLDAEADAARARLKSKLHRAGGGFPIDPEMVLDLAKIAASHIAHGIDAGVQLVKDFGEDIRPHLQEILAKAATLKDKSNRREAALNARPKRMQRTLEKLEAKEASGQVGPEPKPERVPLNPEEQKIQAQIERVRTRIRQRFLANEAARRSPIEKVQDTLVKWRRGFVLSSPTVFAKLTSAALERMGTTAAEEVVGKGLGKGLSRLAERAPREGGASVRIEAEALAEGFTKGMADSWQTLRTGKSDLDAAFGKEGGLPPEAIDFLGTIHSALKAPAKRNEFTRAFAKRAEHAIRNGLDPTDPTVQQRIALDAYKDANRSIFLQDNRVVDAYRRGIHALEAPNKETGKPNPYDKAGATIAKVLLPIVKVPTNIVAETFQYALGAPVGGVEAINAYRRGIETLSPVEADAIMRHLKKGSLGAAVMLLGYLRADQIGGYYTGKRDEKDVKPGELRIFGWNVPSMLVHNPLFEQAQIGATIRRVAESKLRKSDTEEQGVGAGTMATALGLIEEVPFVREAYEMADLKDPNSRGRVVGQTIGSLAIPSAISWIARQIDEDEKGETVKRDPKTINDYIKAGIPGLRETLPEKSTTRPRIGRSLSRR